MEGRSGVVAPIPEVMLGATVMCHSSRDDTLGERCP